MEASVFAGGAALDGFSALFDAIRRPGADASALGCNKGTYLTRLSEDHICTVAHHSGWH